MPRHDRLAALIFVIHVLRYRRECAVAVTSHVVSDARLAQEHARETLAESRLQRLLRNRLNRPKELDAGLN